MELGGIEHRKPRVFLSSTTHGAEIPPLAAFIKTLEIFSRNNPIKENWAKGLQLRQALNELFASSGLSQNLSLVGEDCFFATVANGTDRISPALLRTFLLQELIDRGQLFQGLFYPTPAHDSEVIGQTLDAWSKALPKVVKLLETGDRSMLKGHVIKPVFRTFNYCECTVAGSCAECSK